jgi:hypothetical protein
MKKRAVAAVALTALMVSPVFSAGYVGAKYKFQSTEVEEFAFGMVNTYSLEQSDWQVDGSYGFVQDGFGGQIEGSFASFGDSDVLTLAGHAYWPGDGWRLGGLISFLNIDHGTDAIGSHSEIQELSIGLEGSYDFTSDLVGRLHATIGESESTLSGPMLGSPLSSTNDTWHAEAGASYYLSPRARLDAAIGFGSSSTEQGVESLNLSVGAEYQPLDLPLSITARYNRSSTEYPAIAIENETDTFSVGLRLSFGAETLRDRDRTTPYDGHYGSMQSLRDF